MGKLMKKVFIGFVKFFMATIILALTISMATYYDIPWMFIPVSIIVTSMSSVFVDVAFKDYITESKTEDNETEEG